MQLASFDCQLEGGRAAVEQRPVAAAARGASASATPVDGLDGYRFIRAWWTAVLAAEPERYAGRSGHTLRLLLRALGGAAQNRRSSRRSPCP